MTYSRWFVKTLKIFSVCQASFNIWHWNEVSQDTFWKVPLSWRVSNYGLYWCSSILLSFSLISMIMSLYRVKDPYCISATAVTCVVAGFNLLKVLKSYIFWIGLTFMSANTWFNQLENISLWFFYSWVLLNAYSFSHWISSLATSTINLCTILIGY